jgi:two-component system, NtrC family, sensor histidine kinase HydH
MKHAPVPANPPAASRSSRVDSRHDAIGEMAAGIARELRQPLLAISSAAQLLRFRVAEDPVVEKNVGRILREVERLNTFSSALLEYARTDALHLAHVDPDALWDDVLEDERGRLESRAILVQRSRATPGVHCSVDASQMKRLLTELLENAAEAAPEGTDLVLASTVADDGAWRCELRNGGTLAPEAQQHAFDLFFTTRPGSAGIGLALARRIAEDHGGALTLQGTAQGTTATLTLPASSSGHGS